MAMSSTSCISLPYHGLHHVGKHPSIRPCLVSLSRFQHLSNQHGFYFLKFTNRQQRKKSMTTKSSAQPMPPSTNSDRPKVTSDANRENWILEIIVRMLLPLLKSKWGPFLIFKEEVDTAIETAEEVAEVVEEVAEEVDMVAEELVEMLPEGNIKNAVSTIESVAHQAAKRAQFADATILKVKEFENEVDAYIEPTSTNKGRRTFKEAKPDNEQANKNNRFDGLGSLFPNNFDVVDCFLHHFTSWFNL